jgi:hypothetical protein
MEVQLLRRAGGHPQSLRGADEQRARFWAPVALARAMLIAAARRCRDEMR